MVLVILKRLLGDVSTAMESTRSEMMESTRSVVQEGVFRDGT